MHSTPPLYFREGCVFPSVPAEPLHPQQESQVDCLFCKCTLPLFPLLCPGDFISACCLVSVLHAGHGPVLTTSCLAFLAASPAFSSALPSSLAPAARLVLAKDGLGGTFSLKIIENQSHSGCWYRMDSHRQSFKGVPILGRMENYSLNLLIFLSSFLLQPNGNTSSYFITPDGLGFHSRVTALSFPQYSHSRISSVL
jgi:hypothetical protein